jgi:Bax protein
MKRLGLVALITICFNYWFFHAPAFVADTHENFIKSVNKCVDYINRTNIYQNTIPRDLIITQAVLESNYGQSRYAKQGHNLMGIYMFYNLHKGIKPSEASNDIKFRAAVFKTECDSIQYYVNMLNNKAVYKPFRDERVYQAKHKLNNQYRYFNVMTMYSTNEDYPKLLAETYNYIKKKGFI